jgi:hypothetical protein
MRAGAFLEKLAPFQGMSCPHLSITFFMEYRHMSSKAQQHISSDPSNSSNSLSSFSTDYDPETGISFRPLSENDMRDLVMSMAKTKQADAEANMINAQAVRTKFKLQSKLAMGTVSATILIFTGTCIVSIFGACYPGADKEFLQVILLATWDKWFKLMMLVAAYYFGGMNDKG